jgi:hypothetical protein
MSAIPKCPECFAMLTATLHACGHCGWRDRVIGPIGNPFNIPPTAPPEPDGKRYIPSEELRRRIKALAAHMTRRSREISAARHVHRAEQTGGYEVTPGHGHRCCCELCFRWRMNPAAWREKVKREQDVEELRAELAAELGPRGTWNPDETAEELAARLKKIEAFVAEVNQPQREEKS